jgi:hypothetical protein
LTPRRIFCASRKYFCQFPENRAVKLNLDE